MIRLAPQRIRAGMRAQTWIWSYLAVFVIWLVITAVSGRGLVGTMEAALGIVPFLILVSIGQMFIITLGNGHIDLSIPYVMTLAAFVAAKLMYGPGGSIWIGFLVAMGCGLAVAVINLVGIVILAIPPIVATLAAGLLAASAGFVEAGSFSAAASPAVRNFVVADLAGVSVLAIACIALSIVAALVLSRTRYGRSVQAIGQNVRAATLAGVPVLWVIVGAYVVSAVLAALSGVLLGAFTGTSLGLGDPYLLTSIAVVVLGGSLIAGGSSNVQGIWGGALFLTLIITLLNVLHLNVAVQDIVEGVVIIAVLSMVGNKVEA